MWWIWPLLAAAYLVGAIPFGYLAGKLAGVDVRKVGSGNIGSTNVHRSVGPAAAWTVFLLDSAKGALPVVAVRLLGFGIDWQMAAGLASIAGHNWPVFLKFRGGRGIATSFGVLAAITPEVAGMLIAIFIVVLSISRYISLASLCSAAALPILLIVTKEPASIIAAGLFMAIVAIVRHRANIKRLLNGTEHRFGERVGASQ